MTLQEIASLRLCNQQLAGSKMTSAVEMVEWLGAVQGQEYGPAKWGLGLRLPHLVESDIENDIDTGKILRTHLLRPTWHLVSANDIRWMLQLTAPRVHAVNAFMYRQCELDKKLFNRSIDIIFKTLEGGKQLTRDVINAEFKKHKIIAQGHRLSYIMMNAELEGVICSGAREGNKLTYALLDERVKSKKPMKPDEALTELTKRFFFSRGPASIKDFSTWSGLTVSDCKKGVEMLSKKLDKEVIDRVEYYFSPDFPLDHLPDTIHLLPIYDEFIMGYKDRSAIMTLRKDAPLLYDNMIIFNGQVIGSWRRTIQKSVIQMDFDFLGPLKRNQKTLLKKSVDRFSEFNDIKIDYNKSSI